MSTKDISIAVCGEPAYIKSLIDSISFEPVDSVTLRIKVPGIETKQVLEMNIGKLQVDDNHRIDFFGSNDEALFEFMKTRPANEFNGLIVVVNADDTHRLESIQDDLMQHKNYLKKHALVVAVTGKEYKRIKQAEEHIRQALYDISIVAPVFSIDPENKQDVNLLVESLLCSASPGINESNVATA
ncbi:hypothetical protein [Marinicella litoralis]|uniref:Signal recognition particle receptor subunit beta n=1 Tax=Marinicella litoralis TaxID=644220 RepID=A0A4R6XE34_9GAMM|nr:hypothetical protein [Marinicella litoralis]TDR17572.1 signal recognition particle receptor subunit beta [Marinicella litoralis]